MGIPLDITSQRFGRYTAIRCVGVDKNRHRLWECVCDCGVVKVVVGSLLKYGSVQSCGCLKIDVNTKHGLTDTRIRQVYYNMMGRCYNTKNRRYKDWGGRGISVCDRWRGSLVSFYADMGHPDAGMSLDRIDNDGPYSPENCRWATTRQQTTNRGTNRHVTLGNLTMPCCEWDRKLGLSPGTVSVRLNKGWSIEDALTLPKFGRGLHKFKRKT